MDEVIKCLADKHDKRYAAYNGDCVDVVSQLPENSVDFSVYSPPFVNLFVYSDSERDMGNCTDNEEFFKHYRYLIKEKMRVTKTGRLSAVHCTELPARKFIDGYIGLKDFPGEIIKAHEEEGWIYHSRVTIWRDPVVEMTRTKALGLLYKQLQKDSTKSRMGMADYILVFKKPGENAEPVEQDAGKFPVSQWQKWASPVWMDIDQTRTLNCRMAKEQNDERHMCPLQLDVIERCLYMWSNLNDVVLSPFMGIGSEGVCSLQAGRRFIGVELKQSYFNQACKYLDAECRQMQLSL